MDLYEAADLNAIRRLLTRLAADQLRQSANPGQALQDLASELKELPAEVAENGMDQEDLDGATEAAIDGLVSEIRNQLG